MASDYKESSSNARTLICLVLWVFPLIPALHPVLSTQETTFANASMHACDTRIHLLDKCDHFEGITETPQQSNPYKHDVYWNTSESHCDLTKYEMCQPEPTISPCQQEVDTTQVFTRSKLGNFFQLWMLMMWGMTIILDDVIHAIVPWIICSLRFEDREVPSPGCRTSIVGNPLLRVCRFAFLFGACILALGQGIPLWSLPTAFKAPGPKKRRQDNLEDNSFSLQGVFLKSTQPQQIVRTISTIGDGNCFWRAVARNLPVKWYTLKRCVLRSALHDPDCNIDKSTIKHLMKKNQWADSTAIQLTATFLECNLAIWHKGGIGFFPTTNRNASTIFLSLSRHHFESIPVKRGIKLLATCDPFCPMPIQALPFCVGTEYSDHTTIPCRTLKISRVGYLERFSLTPPHQFANSGNIGLGLLMRNNPQQCCETSQSKTNPKHHSRKKDSRHTSGCQRNAWPIWYLVLMLLLRCLGTCNPTLRASTFQDSIPLNLSTYTICSPNFLYSTLNTPNPKQSPIDPTSAWIHEDQPATQPSSRTVAVANAEAQHVLDTCYGCKESYKQSWPDGYNCSKGCPNHLNSSLPIPVLSLFAPHYLHHNFWGGFANSIPQPHEAMVVTRAEILLEKQLRSLRSLMDSGEAANSREVYEGLHQRHQAVSQALYTKRMARERSKTPIRRRTRREVNRLMRGCHDNASDEQAGAALAQPHDLCKARPPEPTTPPPWVRAAPAVHQQIVIETMGTRPDRAMSASTFDGQADVVVQMRLHEHQDPGRDHRLHAHTGRHQATLRRVAHSQAMQQAFGAVLEISKRKRRIFVEIQCKQGRHRSVAAAECLAQLFRIQSQRTVVDVHHRGAQNNWYTLCHAGTCVECNMYKAQSREGLGLRAELHAVLSPCLTMQVTEHPYVYVGERRSYMMCPTQPCCSNIQAVNCSLAWLQDNGGAHFEDALEHPRVSATPAFVGGCKLKTTLSYPNCLPPYFSDPFPHFCPPDSPIKSSLNLLGKDDAFQLQVSSFKKLRCLDDHCRFRHFSLECLDGSHALSSDDKFSLLAFPPMIQFNLDRRSSDDSPSGPQRAPVSKTYWLYPPQLTSPSCYNSGNGGAHLTASNAISCSYDGTPLLRIRGLPKDPYGVHLSGGCIGAVQTPEGARCKYPRNGSSQTPFGFLGFLVSTPSSSDESLCNPGFSCKKCYIVTMVKDRTGCRTAVAHSCHVGTVHRRDERASQPCCMHYLTCMCSKDCACNSHDYAVCLHRNGSFTLAALHSDLNLLSCHPKIPFQGGYLYGSVAQTALLRHSFVCPPRPRACSPVMPVSPAELLLERQMIRLRTDLHHGPVQQDAQLIADMQRQYRDLQEDLEHRRSERSRSREPILRKSQYELNRLMRGQAPAVAKPGAVVHRPVTPPKTPSPVRPVTPPKTPPSAPPLTLCSTSSSSVPRPPVPLTPKMPSYPPPKVSGSSAPLVPKQPSYPPPPKVPGATQVVPETIAKKAGKPKQPPKPPPAKPSSATVAVPEVPSSSKAPAPDMQKAAAPCTGISNQGPSVAIKKIYIDTLGLRPDNAMAPEQSHPDVQLHIRVDLRKLHNPQQNYSLRSHTGLHKDTLLQIAQHREIPRVLALILQQCNAYDCIHVHIACTQGRHRSVGFSGILRQVLLSHMPQALVFVSHRATLNNWGPLCGMLRCNDCSVFRNLSPEGRALRKRIANAVSSCFTLVVNSHPFVQLDPRYMFACSLCVSDLTCTCLRVQPVEDLQCQHSLHGGALEHHHDRDTANNYRATQPCLLWFLGLLQPPPFPFCSKSFRPMTTCKEQICLRQHPLEARPTTRIETEAGTANHISVTTPNYPSSTSGFDFPDMVKLCSHLPQEVQERLHRYLLLFIGGGNEEHQNITPCWEAFECLQPNTLHFRGSSLCQTQTPINQSNLPPFWDALNLEDLPISTYQAPEDCLTCPESYDCLIPATQDDAALYDIQNEDAQEVCSPCPSTVIDSPTSCDSPTQPYPFYPKNGLCSSPLGFEHSPMSPSNKGIKRKFEDQKVHQTHHHHEDDHEDDNHVWYEQIVDAQSDDAGDFCSQHQCNDEQRSPSITSSYIGSVQNFWIQQGPYPGWEYDEAFVQVNPGQLQLPLIFIPSSPEPPSSYSSPSNASSVARAGRDHWNAWSQDSDGHLHARQTNASADASAYSPSQNPTFELDMWDQVPTQDFLDIMGEQNENPSETSSHPSLNALLWENKPASPMQGGAKSKSDNPAAACTEADISRQVQRIKDLSHGLVSKQLRLLLKGDSKFYKKIVRTTNEEHLLSCILAEAKRIGLTSAASIPDAAAPVQTGTGKGQSHHVQSGGKDQGKNPKGNGKGKSPQGHGQQKGAEKGKSKEEPRRKGNSKGLDGKNKGKGKGLGGPNNPVDRPTFSIVPDGWNVLPAVEYNGTVGGIFAIESEEDARKLAESAANALFPVAILSPKPLGVGIGAPTPLDVEFFENRNGMQQIVTLHTYLHQLTQCEARYAKTARVVQINRPTEARTQIVYLKYTDQGASTQMRIDLQDKRPHQHKTWLQSIINAPSPIQLQDLWHIQDAGIANGIRYYTASARIPSEQVPTALNISQPGRIQTNIPTHIRQEIQHVWLKTPAGAMDDQEVLEVMQKCPVPHLGAFNLRGTWALRVHVSKIDEAKKFLGRDKAPAYFIHGASHDMNSHDIQETCRQINWNVSVGSEDFRVRNGNPVWLVRASHPPPIFGFPLNFGYERLRIQIYAAARAITPAASPKIEAALPPSYSSWQAQSRKAPNDRPHKPTFKEIVQQGGPPVKKSKVMVPGIAVAQNSPRVANPAAPPASNEYSFPSAFSQHQNQDSHSKQRETQLEQQLLAMQQQNQSQSLQIQALMEQIASLTTQLQSLAAMQTSVPHEEDDALMEGGGLQQESS